MMTISLQGVNSRGANVTFVCVYVNRIVFSLQTLSHCFQSNLGEVNVFTDILIKHLLLMAFKEVKVGLGICL